MENKIAEKFQDMQFDDGFAEKIIEEVRAIFLQRRKEYDARKQSFVNKKTALELRRKAAEDKLLSGIMQDEDFTRINNSIKSELQVIDNALAELENKHDIKVDVAQEVLRFTKNIYAAYQKASPALKKHYLNFFWEKFEMDDGVILRPVPILLFRELLQLQQVYFTDKNSLKLKDIGINQEVILNGCLGA